MEVDLSNARAPGLMRRLAAILYDLMLLFGILVLAAAIPIIPWLEVLETDFPGNAWWFRLYLAAVIGGYFVFFWAYRGQTLGMRAWRMQLRRTDGASVRAGDALRRLLWATVALAPAGAGLLWVLLDREGLAWHDRASGTRLVVLKHQDVSPPVAEPTVPPRER